MGHAADALLSRTIRFTTETHRGRTIHALDERLCDQNGGYSNPTSGPIPISSAVIRTTQAALMTRPGGSMSNIR